MTRRTLLGFFAPYLAHKSDQERVSHTLAIFLRILIIVTVSIAGVSVAAGIYMAFLLSALGAAIMAALLVMMRFGHPRAASLLLILTWQIIGIASLATGDGIHDVAIIIFPAVLITGSLLLNRKLYAATAVLSVAAVAAIGVAEVVGVIESPFDEPGRWGDVVNVTLIMICVAILVRYLSEALHLGLEHARRNEQNFREVFNATREAIIVHDARSGEILDVNDAFLTMTGLDRERARAMPPQEFYGRDIGWDQIRRIHTAPAEVVECDLQTEDPIVRRIEVSFRRSTIGGEHRVLAVARDITERQRLEGRLRQSEKMQAVGQLAGGVAHDFNNQLVGIMGYADILRTQLVEDPKLASYADSILSSARRASDLTTHLLAFARKGKVLSALVDLHAIITEVVGLLERSIDKRVVIKLDLGAHPATTLGDPSQIQNCFLNLALNARDAMPDGGELSFETKNIHLDEVYCRTSPYFIEVGDYIEVNVGDSGIGMSRQVLERVFEPFFTTKDNGKGTGMGLAAVYGTVKNHKGTITVDSEEGRGTTFSVRLPLLTEDAGSPVVVEPEVLPAPVVPGAHVLLVDDEESVCDITVKMLDSLGYRVSVCRNGREAAEFLESSAEDVDLVILDMIMPVMGGGATFDALKKTSPAVRVLLSSGYSLDGEAQAILDRGARGFVQKPFLKTELARAIVEALAPES